MTLKDGGYWVSNFWASTVGSSDLRLKWFGLNLGFVSCLFRAESLERQGFWNLECKT